MKITESTNSPSASNHFSKGEGLLNESGLAARRAIPALDRAAGYAHWIVDKTANAAVPAAQWLTGQANVLTRKQKELVSGTRQYVAANPWQSLGMALAAGFAISRLLRK